MRGAPSGWVAVTLAEDRVEWALVEARNVFGVSRVDRFRDLAADSARDPIARRWTHQFPSNSNVEIVVNSGAGVRVMSYRR